MVKHQIQARGIRDEKVLEAMRTVLRHRFCLKRYRSRAYNNTPLPIGHGQTISQPYVVALMTELLEVNASQRVLEVGTGSGYQAAVLAEIVREVYSIEIYAELHERTKENLDQLGYHNIKLRYGDGALGWKEHAPFDAIIVTCAASSIPPALIQQLKVGGKMCIPVGPVYDTQRLVLVEKDEDGKFTTRTITNVRFVPLLSGRNVKKPAPKDGVVSGPGESHPRALPEPCVNVSAHTAPIT